MAVQLSKSSIVFYDNMDNAINTGWIFSTRSSGTYKSPTNSPFCPNDSNCTLLHGAYSRMNKTFPIINSLSLQIQVDIRVDAGGGLLEYMYNTHHEWYTLLYRCAICNGGFYLNASYMLAEPDDATDLTVRFTTEWAVTADLWIDNFYLRTTPTDIPTKQPTTLPTSAPTTRLYSIQYFGGNVSCSNLHENIGIQYDKQMTECLDWCSNRDDCKMFNYFEDFKQINDSRCYIFDKLCDIFI
eukprot:833918_1